MRITAAIILAGVGIAAAEANAVAAPVPSGTPSGCGSAVDAIISACLASTQPLFNACDSQDYHCKCVQATNVLTCYDNCPSDPDEFGAQQNKDVYCNAYKANPTTSRGPAGGGNKPTPAAALSSSSAAGGVHTGFATGSSTPSAMPNSAANLPPAGGLLAAIFGLALL